MENCARQLNGGELEETIVSASGPSATPDVTSNSHTGLEKCILSLDKVALGDCSGARSSMEPKSEYSSKRVEEMMRSRGQFSSDVEHEIEHSKGHWSEVSGHPGSSKDNNDNREVDQDVTSNFHTALEECILSLDEVALGDHSSASSSMGSKSEYFSARVEEMTQIKSLFSSDLEHEIEQSKVHWSEVSGHSDSSKDNNDNGEVDLEKMKVELQNLKVGIENIKVFEELMDDPQWKLSKRGDKLDFFVNCWPPMKLGRKIAEGGQAEIFEVLDHGGTGNRDIVLKVFKKGWRLKDLRTQWPHGITRREVMGVAVLGLILPDGRFAFGMNRFWGDLRKLIDQAMQEKNNQGSPFPYQWSGQTWHAKDIMLLIAVQMVMLHKENIIHRDLKASNILLHACKERHGFVVADFECSIGVTGTGLWRAPEILLALKDKKEIDFSEKADVYAYGMTCFEIVTGRLPFEGELKECLASYDHVIGGQRPKLPSDLDVTLKDLIERCWNPTPNERPSFLEIVEVFIP